MRDVFEKSWFLVTLGGSVDKKERLYKMIKYLIINSYSLNKVANMV